MGARIRLTTALLVRYVLFAVVPFLLFGFVATDYFASYIRQEIQQRNNTLAQIVRGYFAEALTDPYVVLRQVVLQLDTAPSETKVTPLLQLAVSGSKYLESLALLDAEGRITHIGLVPDLEPRRSDLLGLDLSRQPFYDATLASEEFTWSDTFQSLLSGQPALTLSVPYKQQVLVGTFNIAHLARVAVDFQLNAPVQVDLVDQRGTLIFSSRSDPGNSYLSLRHLPPIADGIQGKEGSYTFQRGDQTYLGSVGRIQSAGWLVLVSQPLETALAPFNRLLWFIGAGGLIAALLAAVGAVHLGRRLSFPLNRLSATTRALAKGHYQVPIPEQDYEELEQFAAGFRRMATAIEEREQELVQSRLHYQQLFNSASDAIFVHPVSATMEPIEPMIDVNEAACSLLGFNREALLQKTMAELNPLHGQPNDNAAGILHRLSDEEVVTFESRLLDHRGQRIPVEIKAHRFEFQGRQMLLSIARDIRERVATQKALHALVGSFIDTVGQSSFDRIVRELCAWLNIDGAAIGQLISDTEICPLATFYRGAYQENPMQLVADSPSQATLKRGQIIYPDQAAESFPEDTFLAEHQVRGYIGQALRDNHGKNLGVLIAFHSAPLSLPPNAQEMLQLLATKAATELERNRANQALEIALSSAEEARERIDIILKSLRDGLIVLNANKRITLINRVAENLLELPSGSSLHRPASLVFPFPLLREHLERLDIESAEERQVEFDLRPSENGHARTLQASSSPVLNRFRHPTGFIILIRDVTQERQSQRLKNEFIATAAHELKTPLAAIMGFAELLLEEKEFGPFTAEQRREYLQDIYGKGEFLSQIVDDLLDLGRMETGRPLALHWGEVDLPALIRSVLPHHQRESERHRFELQIPDGPVLVRADQNRLVQVLDNLLTNAVKYSPDGGTIRISGEVTDQRIHLWIQDEGIGIPPDQLERVFEKFFRADAHERGIMGLGLGLNIVKGIVEAHKGQIWAESEVDRGATFHLRFPIAEIPPEAGG